MNGLNVRVNAVQSNPFILQAGNRPSSVKVYSQQVGEAEMQASPLAVQLRRGVPSMASDGQGLRGASVRGTHCVHLSPAPSDLQEHLLISSPAWIVGRQEEPVNLCRLKCFHGRKERRNGKKEFLTIMLIAVTN